jgi:hypothetical protein
MPNGSMPKAPVLNVKADAKLQCKMTVALGIEH